MKHIYHTILVGLSLLAAATTVRAQDVLSKYKEGGGVATSKTVGSQNEDGSYTITLETFATGTSALIPTSTPADVVLVLDFSKSMVDNYYTNKDGVTKTRLAALADAVNTFVEEIAYNDAYDDKGQRRKDQDGNETTLGNRLAIITYSSEATTVVSYQDVFDNQATIKSTFATAVEEREGSGTRTDLAMSAAQTMLTNTVVPYRTGRSEESNKVVVLFTDGAPASRQNEFNTGYANSAINTANGIKTATAYDAVIFTVGLVESDDRNYANCITFMKYVSSNYPNATSMTNAGTGGTDDGEYFQDATQADLSDIFKSISQASGGSAETIGASTQVRDVVSSSFAIAFPSTVTTDAQKQEWINNNVKVYTSTIETDGKDWGEWEEYSDATVTYYTATDESGEEYDAINVQGFDYSAPDVVDADGYVITAGNWVGLRYKSSTETEYAGKKLVIQFNVNIEEGVTGGITGTNTRASGVYVQDEETGEYTCVNEYEVPTKTLSITIKISKEGLRSGESATFLIKKANPKKDADGNIVYNAIGKPEPDESTWDTDHKVILTNKSATDGEVVIKTLYGLDPNYVYEVVEDDWGWAYDMTGTGSSMTTSSVTINPFKFTNKEKTQINGKPVRKHAEAVTINHFGYTITGGEFEGKQEEHYKSSKTKF